MWADVPADHPAAPRVVDRLRAEGFGFGAYVPQASVGGEDVLRLQYPLRPLDPHAIQVLEHVEPLKRDVLEDCGLALVAA